MIKRQSGFTLLEVMIAVTLIAVLSLFTTQSIQRALSTRTKLQHTIEVNAQMREALRIIERDVNLAFHYRDFVIDMYNQAQDDKTKATNTPPPTGQNPNPPNPSAPLNNQAPVAPAKVVKKDPPVQLTQFIGEENKLNFTTSTHARVIQDEQTSFEQEVGYFIKDCKNRHDRTKTSKCLWRRSDPYLDDDPLTGGESSPLLENVESLVFRYLPEGQDEWVDKWNSKDGPAEERDRFPFAVEVTLTVNDPLPGANPQAKKRQVVMQTVAAVRFPNNKQEAANGQGQNGAGALPPLPPPPTK